MTKHSKYELAIAIDNAAAKGWKPREIAEFLNAPIEDVKAVLRRHAMVVATPLDRTARPKRDPKKLGKKALEIYRFLVEHVHAYGYAPSIRDIGEAVELRSSSTVHSHLCKIEEAGLIRRNPNKPRMIQLVDDPLVDRLAVAEGLLRELCALASGELRERAEAFLAAAEGRAA